MDLWEIAQSRLVELDKGISALIGLINSADGLLNDLVRLKQAKIQRNNLLQEWITKGRPLCEDWYL